MSVTDANTIVPLFKQAVADDAPLTRELSAGDTPYSERFLADLLLLFAFDHPDEYEIVLMRHLADLSLKESDLRELAVTNFRRRIPDIERHGTYPVFMLTAGGNLESSLLLLKELWESEEALVPGELVAAVPARDVVVYTGSESPEGLRELRNAVERVWPSGDHLLTKSLLVWRRDGWVVFDEPAA